MKNINDSYFMEKSIQTKNGRIFYYANLAFTDKPTIIFLHGLSSNHTTWINIMEKLREKGFNSLALDLRGHGLSDKTKNKKLYDIPVFSHDLKMITDEEKIKNFILVGYSFGGQIAIDYTVRYPRNVKGLILISVNHTNPLEYKKLKFLTPVFYGILSFLSAILLWQKRKNYHYYRHGKAVGYWDSVYDGLRTMPLSVNFWMLAMVFKIDFKNSVKQIRVPTSIIYGKNDAFITEREVSDMAKSIPGAKIIISKNPDHFVGTNSQEETSRIIFEFLNEMQ